MRATSSHPRRELGLLELAEIVSAGIVGGVVMMLLESKVGVVGSWLKKFFGVRNRKSLGDHGTFDALRQSILGTSKQIIVEVFGPPRASGVIGADQAVPTQQAYWYANTWYYALDPAEQSAVAIEFAEGIATRVDLIRPPYPASASAE